MKRRSERAAQDARRAARAREKAIVANFKKRSRAALKAALTRKLRQIREELFSTLSHSELVRQIRNSTRDWVHFQEMASRAAGWDARRIRDEFFSPKVRGKK
jgi:hypothetical protein